MRAFRIITRMNRVGASPIDRNPYMFEDIELKLSEYGQNIEASSLITDAVQNKEEEKDQNHYRQ